MSNRAGTFHASMFKRIIGAMAVKGDEHQTSTSVAFPWPQGDEFRVPVIRYLVNDAVWIASLTQMANRLRQETGIQVPLVPCSDRHQLLRSNHCRQSIAIVEVSSEQLAEIANWLSADETDRSSASRCWVVALCCRRSLVDAAHRTAAARLLHEAGSRLTLATPREIGSLTPLIRHCYRIWAAERTDLLADLPLPCWGPAWQSPG